MREIVIVSKDTLFSHMLFLELSVFSYPIRVLESLTNDVLYEIFPGESEAPGDDTLSGVHDDGCRLLILDLDMPYHSLDTVLKSAQVHNIPVILFGSPDTDAMSDEKMRFYDSDIYRYVFVRPFLMYKFLYCAKELLHFKEDELLRKKESPAMKMKQHSPADDIRFSEGQRQITYKNDLIRLTPIEYETLLYLMRHRGSVVSRKELFDAVHAKKHIDDGDTSDKKKKDSNVVDVYIRFIRAKIDDRYNVHLIETVRGVGYTIPQKL